mgnify:CR=1 FL=1
MDKPVIGLMLGDATGIGPEISARLLASGVTGEVANVVVIGDRRVLAETAGGTNPYFATGAGGSLQALLFGFGGLDISRPTPTSVMARLIGGAGAGLANASGSAIRKTRNPESTSNLV